MTTATAQQTARPTLAQPGQVPQPQRPIDLIRRDLDKMDREFAMVLPQHIPVDRFKRVVLTAINGDENLLTADRKSLFGACMLAAQDGLLPDKREGVLVVYNTRVKTPQGEKWVKLVQWTPMVYGVIKKMRNSGEVADITAHAVFKKDRFLYILGDEERIEHEPYMGEDDPGPVVAAYSIIKLKDGSKHRTVVPRSGIERARSMSKAPNSPAWQNWYDQMAEKVAIKRGSKRVPMSTEIENILRRDDALAASENKVQPIANGIEIEGMATEEFEPSQIEGAAGEEEGQPTGTISDQSVQAEAQPAATEKKPAKKGKAQPTEAPPPAAANEPEPSTEGEEGEPEQGQEGDVSNLFGKE